MIRVPIAGHRNGRTFPCQLGLQVLSNLAGVDGQYDDITGACGLKEAPGGHFFVGMTFNAVGWDAPRMEAGFLEGWHFAGCAAAQHESQFLDCHTVGCKARGGAGEVGDGLIVPVAGLTEQQRHPPRPQRPGDGE